MPGVTDALVNWPPVLPYDKQAVPVPGTKRPGQTGAYPQYQRTLAEYVLTPPPRLAVQRTVVHAGLWGLIDENTPNTLVTLDQIYNLGLKGGKDRPFLGHRPIVSTSPLKFAPKYTWLTYGEVDARRRRIGSALHALFQKGQLGGGDFQAVGIWSANRPEWQVIDLALQSYQKVSVSLYDTMYLAAYMYAFKLPLSVIFATADHIPTLLKLSSKIPALKTIVCIDTIPVEALKVLKSWSQNVGFDLKSFAEVEAFGEENLSEPIPAHPDLVASICYTSGTTSNPKGVLLKHKNLAVATQSNLYGMSLPEDASLLSYLPLAHIYERICELCVIAVGGKIGYFTGDPLRLLEDAQILRPNFFPSVPRVLNRVYQAAMTGGNVPGLKGALFNKAIQTKLANLKATGQVKHVFWDKLVFRKIQAVLGGELQLVTSGSAPISADVMNFLKIAFACEVAEGYGMTENSATCAKTWPNDPSSAGTVGPPQPVNEIKLVDVPSMNYTSEDKPNPRGEICVRGANCFSVYYKDEKNTVETVEADGWIHTGDVGEIDAAGRLKIIDRVKNIMKLSQGEYVALEKIENVYSSTPIVAQLYVHGDSLQPYLVAVLIPDPVQFAAIASTVTGNKVSPEDASALASACQNPDVVAHALEVLTKVAKKQGLKGFEMIKRLHLSTEPFSVDNNTMTPTLKIRRKDAYNMYKTVIDGLYALGEPTSAGKL